MADVQFRQCRSGLSSCISITQESTANWCLAQSYSFESRAVHLRRQSVRSAIDLGNGQLHPASVTIQMVSHDHGEAVHCAPAAVAECEPAIERHHPADIHIT